MELVGNKIKYHIYLYPPALCCMPHKVLVVLPFVVITFFSSLFGVPLGATIPVVATVVSTTEGYCWYWRVSEIKLGIGSYAFLTLFCVCMSNFFRRSSTPFLCTTLFLSSHICWWSSKTPRISFQVQFLCVSEVLLSYSNCAYAHLLDTNPCKKFSHPWMFWWQIVVHVGCSQGGANMVCEGKICTSRT